jgi:hypothetical protein
MTPDVVQISIESARIGTREQEHSCNPGEQQDECAREFGQVVIQQERKIVPDNPAANAFGLAGESQQRQQRAAQEGAAGELRPGRKRVPLIENRLDAGHDEKERDEECAIAGNAVQRIVDPSRQTSVAPMAHQNPGKDQSQRNRCGAHELPPRRVREELSPKLRVPSRACPFAHARFRSARRPFAGRRDGPGLGSSTRGTSHGKLPVPAGESMGRCVRRACSQCTYTLSGDYSMTFCHLKGVRTASSAPSGQALAHELHT